MRNRRTHDTSGWKLFGWLLDVLVIALLAWLGFNSRQLYQISNKIAAYEESTIHLVESVQAVQTVQARLIEHMHEMEKWQAATHANRFTVQDGIDVMKEFAKLKEYVAKLPLEVPPDWFKATVDGNTIKIRAVDEKHDRKHEAHLSRFHRNNQLP